MKRGSTWGCTPMISTLRKPAPVARTASTCLSEISSIASANSLEMKPIDATIKRHDAGQGTEADRLDKKDSDDDRMKRPA